ncbi:hypothetical protein ACROYT_G019691 [Oculina patagonica]
MSFRPAGAEDSDSDDDGFYMGSIHDSNMNGGFANGTDSRKNFVAMPAGAESDDEDSDGFEFSSAPANSQKSTPTKVTGTHNANSERQYLFAKNDNTSNSLSEKSGLGRGRGLLPQRGRGRGGFPRPPPSFNNVNKGKTSRRSHLTPNKSKQAEAKKAAASLAVEDLRVAVVKGNTTAIQKYLDDGIDPDIQLKSGWTPLLLAASLALSDVMELLASKGANVNFHKEMYTVLMATCAVSGNTPEEQVLRCVELLLERNARVNVYDKYRMSPLMYAAREGRVTVCEKLLQHGAEVNKQDMRGWTSLSWAGSRGHGRVVRTLLDHKADPKIYSNDGQTPSDIAYSSDFPRIADIISLAASGKQVSSEAALQTAESSSVDVKEDSSSGMKYGDLEMFLCGLELTQLLPKFQEHKLTFDEFLNLTEKELDQMGITQVGVRTKILDAIREVHKKEWDVASLQALEKHSLSAPEMTVILANVSKHLTFIRSSVSYVQKHLNTVNEPLEFVQDVTAAEGMELFSKEAVEAVENLSEELHTVKKQIFQIKSKVSNTAPDLIADEKPQSAQHTSRGGFMLVAGVAAVALGAFLVHKGWHTT